ncbi:hypothetical protein TNCV_3878271 [Trichonephila clavipes]|nr:hypothetical protein TNCV_3878271 [Trichonephila clavipes]
MFRRGLHRVVVCIHQIGLLSVNKGEALYVSTCMSGDVGLDNSIRLDGMSTTWGLPIIPRMSPMKFSKPLT